MTHVDARRISLLALAAACAAAASCGPSPRNELARQCDRAASWASAASFGTAAIAAGRAPHAFAVDLYRRGADDAAQIAASIRGLKVDEREREPAARATRQLEDALRAAAAGSPDAARFDAARLELTRLASAARQGGSGSR